VPPRRIRPAERPVGITLDGESIEADASSSVASAILAQGELVLARSPKFHRPRGPSCMRGGCDGCLMRVDGVPNVMTCGVVPRQGMKIERQNVVLSANLDLLRATDWFFPKGMNHHEIFAGVPGVQSVMLAFTRRVSGLGELPEKKLDPRSRAVKSIACDVLVVGGGPAGLSVAAALSPLGVSVVVVDEGRDPGGTLLSFPPGARPRLGARVIDVDVARNELVEHARSAGATIRSSTTLLGVLEGDDWLADDAGEGLVRFEARAHVVATGGHDGVAAFVGNDLPGVVSARAAGRLLREGVLVGDEVVVAGDGPHLEAFAAAAAELGATIERVPLAAVEGVRGMSSVRSVVVREKKSERRIDADALVIGAPTAPAFEIASSGGAPVEHEPRGFRVVIDERSRAPGVEKRPMFALGEIVGAPLDLDALRSAADRIARQFVKDSKGAR
jgi:sarcosine oxidase subunit alpha